ncbi:cell division protein FtsL [bacterium]|nr:cell division protein FtsL [bacterium]
MKDYPIYTNKSSNRLIRKKVNKVENSSKKLAITWIVLVFVALFFVQQRISYLRTEKVVQRLMTEKKRIETSIIPLKLEEQYLTRFSKIEKMAEKNLGLRDPAKWQIFPVVIKPNPEENMQKSETINDE